MSARDREPFDPPGGGSERPPGDTPTATPGHGPVDPPGRGSERPPGDTRSAAQDLKPLEPPEGAPEHTGGDPPLAAPGHVPADPPEGVRALDHTADVGLEIEAPDLSTLFARAAQGMEWLLGEDPEAPAPAGTVHGRAGEVEITLYAPELPVLLADWLRELLYLRQVRGRRFDGARFQELSSTALLARVRLAPAGEPLREIKGVTYHGLEAQRAGGAWHARVIMDV